MKAFFTLVFVAVFNGMFSQTAEFEQKQLIIKVRDAHYDASKLRPDNNTIGIAALDKLNSDFHLSRMQAIGNADKTHAFLLVFSSDVDVAELVRRYGSTGVLEYAEPNYIGRGAGEKGTMSTFPNDTFFNRQWGFFNNGTMSGIGSVSNDADVDMELAWDIETGDPNLIIAVPDSGLKIDHPDIASRVWVNPNEIPGNGIDDDGNGKIDDVNGWDWVNNDNLPADDLGHGTNICGIIGAVANNNSLYTGVNWNSRIMPLKVLNSSNTGSYSNMANSIFYAVDNGANIISFSIGGSGTSTLLYDSINYARQHNVLVVICMMNFNNSVVYYPAGYSMSLDNIISVGSTNANDRRTSPFFWSATSGSNFGPHINVVAPGNYIYGLDNVSNTSANSYWGGTSQATPLVAGIASLLLSANPSLTPADMRTIIQGTAQDLVGAISEDTPGFDNYMGYGRVNANAALQSLSVRNFGIGSQAFRIVNPVKRDVLRLSSNGLSGDFQMSVMNMQGKKMYSGTVAVSEGENELPFPLAGGNYIVTLGNATYSKVFKIVKE